MTAVNLNKELVEEARKVSKQQMRSIAKQIEYWAKIGKAMEDNPSISFNELKKQGG